MGWNPPSFSHLTLILKPTGQGKLSKRDGAKFGFPVFPLSWDSDHEEDNFTGFREDGFLPDAILNFLVLLGWSPGNDQELFTISEMCVAFGLDKIVKSGARFDIDKARWFNQHYIIHSDNLKLAYLIQNKAIEEGYHVSVEYLSEVCRLMKERVHKTDEIISNARFFFAPPQIYDDATIIKKYKSENKEHLLAIGQNLINNQGDTTEAIIKGYISDLGLKLGDYMPLLRIAVSGSMQGPDLMESITVIGKEECGNRILKAVSYFETLCAV